MGALGKHLGPAADVALRALKDAILPNNPSPGDINVPNGNIYEQDNQVARMPGTSISVNLGLDTWRTPNADRSTLVQAHLQAQTDGTNNAGIQLKVDESGETTNDYGIMNIAFADSNMNGNTDVLPLRVFIVPAGGSYMIENASDPNSNNKIKSIREFTL